MKTPIRIPPQSLQTTLVSTPLEGLAIGNCLNFTYTSRTFHYFILSLQWNLPKESASDWTFRKFTVISVI